MSQQNNVAMQIPAAELQSITKMIADLKTAFAPYVISLSPEDRHDMLKMNDKSVSFVDKCMDYTGTNPEFIPRNLNVEDMRVDVTAVGDLYPLLKSLTQVTDNVSDTVMLSGSEGFKGALLYYSSVQLAMKTDEPDAKTIYEDLSKRYPGRSGLKPEPTEKKPETTEKP